MVEAAGIAEFAVTGFHVVAARRSFIIGVDGAELGFTKAAGQWISRPSQLVITVRELTVGLERAIARPLVMTTQLRFVALLQLIERVVVFKLLPRPFGELADTILRIEEVLLGRAVGGIARATVSVGALFA